MRSKQSGFTLIEIAIVLVIIGLLLGGVLKGQELINSAKVKNMATDFRNIPLFIYGYQDKFKALPGDHSTVTTAIPGATACAPAAVSHCAVGNGVIDGVWTATSVVDETFVFWNHVRLAGLAAGPTLTTDPNYRPSNADGGRIGIESGGAATGGAFIQNATVAAGVTTAVAGSFFTPTYLLCSAGILGKYAKQLDIMLDDGEVATGSVRAVADLSAGTPHARGTPAEVGTQLVVDSNPYTVCMGL